MIARTPVGIHATSAKALAYRPIEVCHCIGPCLCEGHDGRDDFGRHCQGHLGPQLSEDCPQAETGCLCHTIPGTCRQGRDCPYRQPDPDAMDRVVSIVRFVLASCGAVIAFALIVLPDHPDAWWPW